MTNFELKFLAAITKAFSDAGITLETSSYAKAELLTTLNTYAEQFDKNAVSVLETTDKELLIDAIIAGVSDVQYGSDRSGWILDVAQHGYTGWNNASDITVLTEVIFNNPIYSRLISENKEPIPDVSIAQSLALLKAFANPESMGLSAIETRLSMPEAFELFKASQLELFESVISSPGANDEQKKQAAQYFAEFEAICAERADLTESAPAMSM